MKNTFKALQGIIKSLPLQEEVEKMSNGQRPSSLRPHHGFCLLIVPIVFILVLGCATTLNNIQKWESAQDIPHLVSALGDDNHDGSDAAISALVRIGESSIEPLTGAIESVDYSERGRRQDANAVLALGLIGPKARMSVPAMLRRTVHLTLPMGATRLVDYQKQTIFESRVMVRSTYSASIAGVPQPQETYGYSISEFAVWAWALTQITGRNFGLDQEQWEKWQETGQ